jgi:hypothetical protein
MFAPTTVSQKTPSQANNTTEVRLQSSIAQKGTREMTYAQAMAKLNK